MGKKSELLKFDSVSTFVFLLKSESEHIMIWIQSRKLPNSNPYWTDKPHTNPNKIVWIPNTDFRRTPRTTVPTDPLPLASQAPPAARVANGNCTDKLWIFTLSLVWFVAGKSTGKKFCGWLVSGLGSRSFHSFSHFFFCWLIILMNINKI